MILPIASPTSFGAQAMQKPLLVAHRLLGFHVEAHQRGGKPVRHVPGDAADGAGLALEIEHRHVAFGGGVEFQDLRNMKARLEFLPDVGPQAVAADEAQFVARLVRAWRRMHQIAAELADILEQRAIVAHHVVPEFARREALADHHRTAVHQQRAGRRQSAGRVIHRQAVIHAVVRRGAHDAGKAVAGEHDAIVVDVRRLRHAGGAGGVDVKRAVLDGQRRPLGRFQRRFVEGLDRDVEALAALARPVNPQLGFALELRRDGADHVHIVGGDDDVFGLHQVDAVRERQARPDWY